MDKRNRNIIALGLLTIVAAVVFFWGLYFLLGNTALRGGTELTLALDDGGGVKRGDRVHVQGVEVGNVQSVRLNDAGGVSARIRVDGDIVLPADTRAAIAGDVFGAHVVELRPGKALVRLERGDTIYGVADPGPLQLAAGLGEQASELLTSADSLLSPDMIANVRATAEVLPASALELRAVFGELREASAALRRTIENVEQARTGDQLAGAVLQVERSADALASAAGAIERSFGSLDAVLTKIDGGHGTLGLLVNDSTLYVQLSETLREMGALATDVRERPGRYISLRLF
ncbi:MAG: MlaD family protein [Longimicrobiales bacterium]